MKYLKKFEKISQFEDFKNGSEWITPNVSYVVETSECNFQPYVPPPPEPTVIATYDAISPYDMLALNSTTGVKQFFIDGVEIVDFGSSYSFETEGEHTVRVILDENATIAPYLFSETPITSAVINDLVTSIGDYAFYLCPYLTNITIPNSVTSIGEAAFMKCNGLTNIIIPESVTSIEAFTFKECVNLNNIVIPNSVTSIGDRAFHTCWYLTNITIPNSVTSIGDSVFSYCDNLNNITCYAKTAPSIYSETFIDISKFGTLYYPKGSNYSVWLSDNLYYLGYYYWSHQEI